MSLKQDLLNSARHFCKIMDIEEKTIEQYTLSNNYSIAFGDTEEYGFAISVSGYDKENGIIDRIIISTENHKGKFLYSESRDQELLEHFLNQYREFYDWIEEQLEYLDLKMGRFQEKQMGN